MRHPGWFAVIRAKYHGRFLCSESVSRYTGVCKQVFRVVCANLWLAHKHKPNIPTDDNTGNRKHDAGFCLVNTTWLVCLDAPHFKRFMPPQHSHFHTNVTRFYLNIYVRPVHIRQVDVVGPEVYLTRATNFLSIYFARFFWNDILVLKLSKKNWRLIQQIIHENFAITSAKTVSCWLL